MEVDDEDEEVKKALLMSLGKDPNNGSAAAADGAAGGTAAAAKVPASEKVNKEVLEQLCEMVGGRDAGCAAIPSPTARESRAAPLTIHTGRRAGRASPGSGLRRRCGRRAPLSSRPSTGSPVRARGGRRKRRTTQRGDSPRRPLRGIARTAGEERWGAGGVIGRGGGRARRRRRHRRAAPR